MSFGLKMSFGRICKVEAFKQLYETGLRPRIFTELWSELIRKEDRVGWSIFEIPGRWSFNPRGIIKIKKHKDDK